MMVACASWYGRVWCSVLWLFVAAVASTVAAELRLPLETTVKSVRLPPPAAMPPGPPQMGVRPVPPPTTPAAKYPQYRMSYQRAQPPAANSDSPAFRFFLNLPTDTLLVEAKVTIDNLPFAMLRKQRAEQILKELNGARITSANVTLDSLTQPGGKAATAENATGEKRAGEASAMGNLANSNVADRLRHIMEVTGEAPTIAEVEWMLSRWIDGPTILPLNANFQRFRANQRPEFVVLDRNRDGAVSAEEMQSADKSFRECDLNQDGMVQFTEIAAAAADPRATTTVIEAGELMAFVPLHEAPAGVSRFDTNGNGQFELVELDAIRQRNPDLSVAVTFNSVNQEQSRIAVTVVSDDFQQSMELISADSTGITLMVKGTPLILAAIQMQPSDQISIGAVNDGYPLLPALDPNDDGRLTVRELRGAAATLQSFDRNHDGTLTLDEVRSPIRLCIGLGASVHRELLGIRSLHRSETVPTQVGPEWFVRMDRNKDNDLTRAEFPGTDEQFQKLDADQDELVSASEAVQFDKQAEKPKQNDAERPVENPGPATAVDPNSKEETKP